MFGGGLFLLLGAGKARLFLADLFLSVWTVYAACGFDFSAQASRSMISGHPGLARPSMFNTRNFISCFGILVLFLVIFASWMFRIFHLHDFSQTSTERWYVRRFSTFGHSSFFKFVDMDDA